MPTKPCLPCPSSPDLAKPLEAMPAMPCPVAPDRASSCRATPAMPIPFSPGRSKPGLPVPALTCPTKGIHACHALPAWPFRPDRAMPAAPTLASTGHAFRTMPANPCHSARCLASRAISCQPRGCQESRHHQHSRCEPSDRVEPQEAHKPCCQEEQQGRGGTVGGGVTHQVISETGLLCVALWL